MIHNQTGLLIEPGNENQLLDAIETYIAEPDLSARHGIAGRMLMETQFNNDAFAPAYVQLYKELL